MPQRKKTPAGPLLLVAVGMLVMTTASIRMWRGPIWDTSGKGRIAHYKARRATISIATKATPRPDQRLAAHTPKRVIDSFGPMPMMAEIAPPVANRIELDPVVNVEPQVDMRPTPFDAHESQSSPLTASDTKPELSTTPSLTRTPSEQVPHVQRAWPYPVALIAALEPLHQSIHTAAWSNQVRASLDELVSSSSLSAADADRALTKLEKLATEAPQISQQVTTREERARLSRVTYGLVRRVKVWRRAATIASDAAPATAQANTELSQLLTAVDQHFAKVPAWKEFFLLPQLQSSLNDEATLQGLAKRVLHRIEATPLTTEQRAVLTQSPVAELTDALQAIYSPTVDPSSLLAAVEQLEVSDHTPAAVEVAQAWQRLRWSSSPAAQALAEDLNTYYRNANVRVAVSGNLLNMLLPQPGTSAESVMDEIQGAEVTGCSQTSARLRVVLLPDLRRLRLGIEAIGDIHSETAAVKGPATLHSHGLAHFHTRKMLTVDRHGMRVWRSQAEVASNNELTGIDTDYDGIPLLGMFARAIVRQEHDDRHDLATSEVRGKVAFRAERRFDTDIQKRLANAERDFLKRVYQPLDHLQLEPTAVDLQTTRAQLIARYRVAGTHQMAAYTPRPAVAEDSLLNMQLHHSTLNNVLGQLKLDGRRVDLADLYREISKTFNIPLTPETEESLPEKVTLEFAPYDAVRVACRNGQMTLTLKVVELSQGRDRVWKNFTVRAHYAPSLESLDAKLVRTGTIELEGEDLGFRDQVALRGVFAKALSKERTLSLLPPQIVKDTRLSSLAIEQFTIEDGWIGLSLRDAPLANLAKQPSKKTTR